MSIPIRIAVRVDFANGSEYEYEVLGPGAVAMPHLPGWRPEPVTTAGEAERMTLDHERQLERDFLIRLLRVVADDDDLDPFGAEFAVITAGRKENGAITYWPWQKGEILAVPLDHLGQRDLREGRGFHKYDIGYERFGRDYAAAKRRSDEVKAARDADWRDSPGSRFGD